MTTVVHNAAQNSSDNLLSYRPDSHYHSDVVYWCGGSCQHRTITTTVIQICNMYPGTRECEGRLALADMLLKPLLCSAERNVVSDPADVAPGATANDASGVEMRCADKPLAKDIP